MPIDDDAVEAAQLKILAAAKENNWDVHWSEASMSGPGIVQVLGQPALAKTSEEQATNAEAFDRMVNELGWIRHSTGILYKVTKEGRTALQEKQAGVGLMTTTQSKSGAEDYSNKVFIVHGQDEILKVQVSHLIYQLGLQPVILHDQPNGGRTIVEKLEAHSNVGFAVVLLTPDDMGYSAIDGASKVRPRARQNVIMELGFFMAKITRGRVCALYVDGVDVPSDFHGVLYVKLDAHGAWKTLLARELDNAGLNPNFKNIGT
jgi:predicted nucleotide-binding protein